MKFDQVYNQLLNYQTELNLRMVLLAENTLREIYSCIVATGARDCLELGTGFGATACVMAAAIEEGGTGTVTTVDRIVRQPVGIDQLAQLTGLSQYIQCVPHSAGYNWYLLRVLQERTRGSVSEPRFDFCYLDGAHEWQPDALAVLLVTKLLRPGAWMMVDDLNFKLRGCHPGWEATYSDRSEEELDTAQVGMVFDLLVKTHPDLEHFMLSNGGHIGWARKVGPTPASWFPDGVVCGAIVGSWSASLDGIEVTRDAPRTEGVETEEDGKGVLIRSTTTDPSVVIRSPIEPPRAIDFVSLRIRLLAPDMDTLQLFWIGGDDQNFHEERSTRCAVRSTGDMQDLTFRLRGSAHARTIRLFRLDPGDGPCAMLLERLTIGGM
jgi:predicted O-methyltransferase YrrM